MGIGRKVSEGASERGEADLLLRDVMSILDLTRLSLPRLIHRLQATNKL